MAEMILTSLVWFTIVGLAIFVFIYAFLKPWRDPMGRHILIFMAVLAIAFAYVPIGTGLHRDARILGWNIVIGFVSIVVWWRVFILIVFQIKDRTDLFKGLRKKKK